MKITRYICSLTIAAGLSVAAAPKPLTAEQKLSVAQAQLDVRTAQAEYGAIRAQAAEKESEIREKANALTRLMEDLRNASGAKGCNLTEKRDWECPKEEKK